VKWEELQLQASAIIHSMALIEPKKTIQHLFLDLPVHIQNLHMQKGVPNVSI
jgi:hypothetical protein